MPSDRPGLRPLVVASCVLALALSVAPAAEAAPDRASITLVAQTTDPPPNDLQIAFPKKPPTRSLWNTLFYDDKGNVDKMFVAMVALTLVLAFFGIDQTRLFWGRRDSCDDRHWNQHGGHDHGNAGPFDPPEA